MAWTTYKGLEVPDSTSGDAGTNLSDNFKALADRTAGTTGSVVFIGASGYATQNNANFFFDTTNVRLGVGTAAPAAGVHVVAAAPTIRLTDSQDRILQLTGPTSGSGSLALLGTGADLEIASNTSSGGSLVFKSSNVERGRFTGSGSSTTFLVSGGIGTAVVSKTTTYTLTALDSVVRADASGGAFTLTLPTAVGCTGRQYWLKKIDSSANAVTIATTSSQTIDGASTYSLATQYAHVLLISDGANWMVF
jgi:hypothetical protein